MGSPGTVKLDEIFEFNYLTYNWFNFIVPERPNFFIFVWIFLDYKLSISHSPCPPATGGTWNVKITGQVTWLKCLFYQEVLWKIFREIWNDIKILDPCFYRQINLRTKTFTAPPNYDTWLMAKFEYGSTCNWSVTINFNRFFFKILIF